MVRRFLFTHVIQIRVMVRFLQPDFDWVFVFGQSSHFDQKNYWAMRCLAGNGVSGYYHDK
ncbi:MAG: hypothetical protein FWF26_04240 [Treponema sp.]|nr:hypothetical protein [Treponema sp.]